MSPRIATAARVGAATVLPLLLLAACSEPGLPDAESPSPSVGGPTEVAPPPMSSEPPSDEPTTVVTGLDAPWSIVFTAGGTPIVDERDTGRILEVLADGSTREIGTIDGVDRGGEGGLLGLALDDQDRLYTYATVGGENRIDRYELTGAAGSYHLGESKAILDGIPAGRNHNGGRLAFGPDGMLYATAGDTGDRTSSQSLQTLAGKILRMTPDGDVPPDNPFAGSYVYSYGHRNPQGIAWSEDGTMFASEFGQSTWDELNIITPGGNYGWPEVEGIGGTERGYVDPVQQWSPSDASPSGIAVVDGTVYIASLRGELLIAVPAAAASTSIRLVDGEYGRLRDVTFAPDGTLWVLTNNTDGRGSPDDGDDRILSIPLGS